MGNTAKYFIKIHLRKPSFLVLILLMVSYISNGQIGNEWVVNGQKYVKIPVAKTGIYGISGQQILSYFPNASGSFGTLQLFHRGNEQAIQIEGVSDGNFNANDSIFFYGQINDGTLDSLWFLPGTQTHKYYNHYSDTTAYFLTMSSGQAGKRMKVNAFVDYATKITNHSKDTLLLFTQVYSAGLNYSYNDNINLSYGDRGEGWFGPNFILKTGETRPSSETYKVPIHNSLGANIVLEGMVVGKNNTQHNFQIAIGLNKLKPDTSFTIPTFNDRDVIKFRYIIPSKYYSKGFLNITGFSGHRDDLVAIAYFNLKYSQLNSIDENGGKIINIQKSSPAGAVVQVSKATTSKYFVYNLSNTSDVEINTYQVQADKISFSTLNTSFSKFFIASKASIFKVSILSEVVFQKEFSGDSATFLIITHKKLVAGASKYAEYRSSPSGGNHKVLIAEINNLYDNYTYGEKSPLAIRRYCMHVLKQGWKPQNLFIIGKGLDQQFGDPVYRKDPRPAISKGFEDLVPAFGFPPSDILQTTGLDANNPLGPAIATGRIPASDNASVLNYLEKVKEHEMLPIEKWRKNIIHISGGNTEQEGKSLKTKMDSWKEMAEGIYFGGHVKHFAKLSNTLKPIDDVFKQEIAQEVNKGASYLTYFGHSTAAATEVDFGKPTEVTNGYANTGKYPFMYMNGCHISNSFGINSFSQDWLLSPGKGAIAYLGHVNFGFTEEFNVYGQAFYRRNFQDPVFQNKSIGATQIQVIKDYFEVSGIFAVTQAHAAQMMLQGDPSLKIFKPQLPDYKFESAYIRSFTGRPVTATSDSFQVAIAVSNLGLVKKDSFSIAIIRTVVEQNKTFTQHPQVFPAVYFEDTLYFTMRSTDKNTFGINTFEIRLDPKDSIAELSELNNTGTIQLFMPASAVNPLFPKEFSIVSSSQVELVAQSTDLMSDSRQYIFEIDTTYLFNSPFKKLVEQTSPALVKSGKLSLLTGLANDSMVYFWRVRYKDVAGEEIIWGESSFIVINGSKPGWSQAKFSQFLKNNIDKGFIDVNKERIQFKSTTNTIFVQVMGEKLATPSNPKNFNFKFNNSSLIENGDGKCGQWGIGAVCINNITGDFYLPAGTKTYCQYGYKDVRPLAFFPFNSSDTSIGTQLINYIKGVPTDYYVLLFNIGNANFHKWSPLLKSTIKSSFKATLADSLKQGSGYILWAQKNTKIGPIAEKVALPLGSVSVNTTFNIAEPFTQMKSTLIGPSNEWGTIYRKYKEVQSSDKFVFQLLGVNYAGKETFLKTISKDTFSISDISAKDYPYLRLVASISDTANRTAINLYEWQVIYNGIPEGTLNLGIAGKELYKGISKNEGDNIDLAFAFENISQFPFVDTLKARVRITDSKNQNKDTLVTLRKLAPGEVVNFTYKGNTKGFDSKNTIQLFVNPYLQAEEYYNNNIIEIPVTVNLDKTSPIVDVAIDGVHILNGDIVSPSPLINIRMNDENRYLTYEGIKDTSLVKIYLAGPCSYCSSTIPLKLYGNADVRYIGKGEGSGNNLVIDYNPQKLPDGKYTLTVSGKDLSGNNTQKPYQITFEVINKSSITYFYPYPNPFSTSTRFVFTLTGSEIPEDLKIQIMTVTGKVVREITKSELGPLRIGNNISQYAWDGFDEYGDKLANGVYLYRVIIKNPGDNFQRRETSADKAFKKEFGKLYILR